jgi:GNAT superfamily N-acetyltransferase
VIGWPRPGDVGFVAEKTQPIGETWWSYFSKGDPGFGFVDEVTPEVSLGVVAQERGAGVGTLLLETLIEEAARRSIRKLSLSVEVENPALRLYERLGFEASASVGSALTVNLDR